MPTAFDPEQAVQTGLLGAAGPVEVLLGPCTIDYYEYKKKDGTVVAKTVAAIVPMRPEGEVDSNGNPKIYEQVYSVGDVKTHHPNPDKASFEGPLVKGSNFNFFLENLINAGFPKHLLASGNIFALNGAKVVVEQKKPAARNIKGSTEEQANKAVVVPIKVISPAPGEDWPANGKPVAPVSAVAGAVKAAKAPAQKKAAAPAAQPAPAVDDNQVSTTAELLVTGLITKAGDTGFSAKDASGSYATGIGKKATFEYMKNMQANPTQFPPNMRNPVVALVSNPEWLADGSRPWAFDEESGMLVGG